MRTYDRALWFPSMLHMHQRRLCAGIEKRSIGRREDRACRTDIEYHVIEGELAEMEKGGGGIASVKYACDETRSHASG